MAQTRVSVKLPTGYQGIASGQKIIKLFSMTLWTEVLDVWAQLEDRDGIGGQP